MAVPDEEPVAAVRTGALAAFGHRDFRIFWFAALASNTGGWMQNATIPYVAFQLTGRDAGVGITGFWQYLPIMLMGAVGGSFADRFDRRRLLGVTQVVQAAFAVALWVMMVTDSATLPLLTVLAFGSGLAGGLNIPVWQSYVVSLIPKRDLMNAVTLNSTQFNGARALGTFLAGVVIAGIGPSAAFGLNAVSFGCVLVALGFIRTRAVRPPQNGRRSVASDLLAGIRYVWSVPGIVASCAAIAAIAGIASPLFSFLTASYGQELFALSGWRLGVLWSAGGLGSLLLAPLVLTMGARVPRRAMLIVAMLGYAAGTIVVGAAPTWGIAVVGLVIYGGAYLAIASTLNTTIQLLAREDMRGKSIAIYVMCLTGALPIGLLVWGFAADRFGIRVVTVGSGLLLIVVTVVMNVTGRFDAMVAADHLRDGTDADDSAAQPSSSS